MNNQIAQFAMAALNANPNFRNKPMAQEFMRILQSGNEAEGIEMANNIMQSYGLSKDQAVQQAGQGLMSIFGQNGRR